jgi:molybdopterin synthase catalytic subunit
MANSPCEVRLKQVPLEASKTPRKSGVGAVVEFLGVVRELEDGRPIDGIDYEAHSKMAEHQLRLVAEKAILDFRLLKIVIHHRVGFVRAGEPSLLLRLEAAHRGQALDACRWTVDELKRRVPIWKHPRFKAGYPSLKSAAKRPGSATPATAK